ncbi:MAG: hypothetical protein ACPG77_07255, partial [Nannocystaceae bacterium]
MEAKNLASPPLDAAELWTGGLSNDIARVLYSREQLAARVLEIGAQLAEVYRNRDVLVVGVLCG